MPTPKSVSVVVYGGKCLKSKKGDGIPTAWVVFGFGKSKCCTAQVKDRNPKWNEENTFKISDPKLPLKLTVKDKDDTLGQIRIPLTDIPHEEHTFKWVTIGPHRRNLNPCGEICIDCWIEEYSEFDADKKQSNFSKFKKKLNIKQLAEERGRKGSIKYGATSLKGSVSVEDLGANKYKPTFSKTLGRPKDNSSNLKRASSVFMLPKKELFVSPKTDRSPSLNDLPPVTEKLFQPPEIKLVTPISGPASGGTLIQITGRNLGNSKKDVTELKVAEYDCLATIEYVSHEKLMCTTPPGEGVGPIVLTTGSGGTCISKIKFEFEKDDFTIEETRKEVILEEEANVRKIQNATPEKLEKKTQNGRRFSLGSVLDKKPPPSPKPLPSPSPSPDWRKEVESLTNEVEVLKKENTELKSYVDRLLLYLMEKYPEALESRRLYR